MGQICMAEPVAGAPAPCCEPLSSRVKPCGCPEPRKSSVLADGRGEPTVLAAGGCSLAHQTWDCVTGGVEKPVGQPVWGSYREVCVNQACHLIGTQR